MVINFHTYVLITTNVYTCLRSNVKRNYAYAYFQWFTITVHVPDDVNFARKQHHKNSWKLLIIKACMFLCLSAWCLLLVHPEACRLIAAQTVTCSTTSIMFAYVNWLETSMHPGYFDINIKCIGNQIIKWQIFEMVTYIIGHCFIV